MSSFNVNNVLPERQIGSALNFKRVLTTCPQQYQDRLAGAVIRHGGRPIWVPGIQINELSCAEDIEYRNYSLTNLNTVKYLILPSKNAMFACLKACSGSVDVFQERLNHQSQHVEVWAMGADANYLRENLGIKNVRKPKIASTDGIIHAMKENSIQPGDALVFAPDVLPPLTEPEVVPNFLENLKTVGVNPYRIPAYETAVGPSLSEIESEVKMLLDGCISAIAFTSTAESEGLCHIIGKETLRQCIAEHDIIIAAHGLTTAKGVTRVLDHKGKICVSKDSSTFEGIVAAIAENV